MPLKAKRSPCRKPASRPQAASTTTFSTSPAARSIESPLAWGNWQTCTIGAMRNASFTVSRRSCAYNACMDDAAAILACERYNARAQAEGWQSLCDAALGFHRLEFRVLTATWRSFATRQLPSRKDFTPRSLKSLLRNVVIYER